MMYLFKHMDNFTYLEPHSTYKGLYVCEESGEEQKTSTAWVVEYIQGNTEVFYVSICLIPLYLWKS
jgi:hypothetical protein